MSSIELKVSGLSCSACVLHLTRALEAVEGVRTAHVDLKNQTARIEADEVAGVALDSATLVAAVEEAGYEAVQVAPLTEPQISGQTTTPSSTICIAVVPSGGSCCNA